MAPRGGVEPPLLIYRGLRQRDFANMGSARLVCVFFQPRGRQFRLLRSLCLALVLALPRLRWFRFIFSLALGVGSYRGCSGFLAPFSVLRLVFGLLLRGGFVSVLSYSGASYGERSSTLTMF